MSLSLLTPPVTGRGHPGSWHLEQRIGQNAQTKQGRNERIYWNWKYAPQCGSRPEHKGLRAPLQIFGMFKYSLEVSIGYLVYALCNWRRGSKVTKSVTQHTLYGADISCYCWSVNWPYIPCLQTLYSCLISLLRDGILMNLYGRWRDKWSFLCNCFMLAWGVVPTY